MILETSWILAIKLSFKDWTRMNQEYQEELRKCRMWYDSPETELPVGTVVLVLDKMSEARLSWPKAVVLGVERDANGVIQTVSILYKKTETKRSIHSLAPVPGWF